MRSIGNIPSLDAEAEQRLLEAMRAGDPRAKDQLVRACLPFVISVARRYRAWCVPLEDLIQQGSIGLLRALEKFDPARGVRVVTYASFWVRAEIRAYVVGNYRSVRLGATATERRAIRAFRTRPVADADELAEISGMPLSRAQKLWPLLQRSDVALDAQTPTGARGDRLADDAPTPEQNVADAQQADRLRRHMPEALAALSDRERHIVQARLISEEPPTLRELGADMGLSRERVRQLENQGAAKLKSALRGLAA